MNIGLDFLVHKDIVTAALGCLQILQQTNFSSLENSSVQCQHLAGPRSAIGRSPDS